MKKIAVCFNNVTKRYFKGKRYQPTFREWLGAIFSDQKFQRPQFKAINNLSFQIEKGQVVGFIGSNGAGKSTILKLILKITYPNEGSIILHGKTAGLLELGAGFHPELTGKENIFLYASILGLSRERIKKAYPKIVKFSGIKDFINSPIRHYSSGMLARLGFSVAIHIEPDILLIDEVLSVGDLAFQKKCMNFIKAYCQNPKHTVVFVSHNVESVKAICDKVIWLEHGQIKQSGNVDQVLVKYINYQQRKSE